MQRDVGPGDLGPGGCGYPLLTSGKGNFTQTCLSCSPCTLKQLLEGNSSSMEWCSLWNTPGQQKYPGGKK